MRRPPPVNLLPRNPETPPPPLTLPNPCEATDVPTSLLLFGGGGKGLDNLCRSSQRSARTSHGHGWAAPRVGGHEWVVGRGGGGKGLDPPIMAWSWGQGWLRPSWGCTEAIGRALNNSTIKYKHKGKSLN